MAKQRGEGSLPGCSFSRVRQRGVRQSRQTRQARSPAPPAALLTSLLSLQLISPRSPYTSPKRGAPPWCSWTADGRQKVCASHAPTSATPHSAPALPSPPARLYLPLPRPGQRRRLRRRARRGESPPTPCRPPRSVRLRPRATVAEGARRSSLQPEPGSAFLASSLQRGDGGGGAEASLCCAAERAGGRPVQTGCN